MIDAGTMIKQIRQEKNLSRRDLSDITGYHENSINNWEHGLSVPKVDSWIDVIETMGYKVIVVRKEWME